MSVPWNTASGMAGRGLAEVGWLDGGGGLG